ncbi:hypothetical protein Q3G72_033847 [Acer saccharum]|nr:hypothetical protein Q3G72_033847 [Acer saccharum]
MFTGLLGNLLILSYFAWEKGERDNCGANIGRCVYYAIIVQLAMAEAMPLPIFVITSGDVVYICTIQYPAWDNCLCCREELRLPLKGFHPLQMRLED